MSDPPVYAGKMTIPEFRVFLGRWRRGEFKGQRFGKAFLTELRIRGPWDDFTKVEERLYYTTDKVEANRLILKNFLEY